MLTYCGAGTAKVRCYVYIVKVCRDVDNVKVNCDVDILWWLAL